MIPLLVLCAGQVLANRAPSHAATAVRADPSSSWMSYAKFDAGDIITQMNVTVCV